ncbi:MAG: EamA family transporter [Polyangiaceae bacterium]
MSALPVRPSLSPPVAAAAPAVKLSGLSQVSLALVYLVWGSTYLAMRVAIVDLPPMMMGAGRFVLAGALLLAFARARGSAWPTRREWLASALPGVLLFVVGNGMVAIAQRWVPSGIAAVVCATMPLFAIGWAWAFGERPERRHVVGIGVGVLGVAVLSAGTLARLTDWRGALVLLAPVGWSLGSLLTRRLPMPRGLMAAGAPMVWGGLAMGVVSLARGEAWPAHVGPTSIGALVYLTLVGSVVTFAAYSHLLRETPPAVATSYAYVNPIVAVVLGVAVGGERFGPSLGVGAFLVVLGVFLTLRGSFLLPSALPSKETRDGADGEVRGRAEQGQGPQQGSVER